MESIALLLHWKNDSKIEKKGFKLFVRYTWSIFTNINNESLQNFSVLLYFSKARATIKPGKHTQSSSRVTLDLPGKNWRAAIESASASPNTPTLAACCRYDVEVSSPIGWSNIRRKYTTTLPGLWRKSIVHELRKGLQLSPTYAGKYYFSPKRHV